MDKLVKKLIIFDMDGTLINSGNAISNTINFVRSNIGLKPIKKTILLKNINNPDINSAEFFYGTKEFTQRQTELFAQYYDKHCVDDIQIYPGIKELIINLSKNYTLCVATNASKEFAVKMLDAVNILKYFDTVVGYNSVDKPKPDPQMLKLICSKLNISPRDAVLIGDSLKDKKAADAYGMESILVDWGFSDFNSKTYDVVKTTKELEKLFE
jgi:phosphoglycolate phosphatase